MSNDNNNGHPMTAHEFTDGLIRVALIMLMVVASFRIFSPFMNLMMWALILAVTIYPSHQKLAAKLGGKQGRSATIIVLIGMLILGLPVTIIGSSLAEQLREVSESYQSGSLALRPPAESVAEWPIVGEQVYTAWSKASSDLPEFIEENRTSIETMIENGLATAKSVAGDVFMFLGALIVAGIMMAFGKSGSEAIHAILSRLAGEDHGPRVHTLATMTTRSVAAGVLGVALIQAILAGLGFVLAGVPFAGVLAFAVLLMAIMQLPSVILILPVILWIWNSGDAGTAMNVFWTIYLAMAALSDNVLKPMLLGRGVDAPMPVILIGALGGMISTGFIGLFVGAVVLAVGYQIFMAWVAMQNQTDTTEEEVTEAAE